MGKPPEMRTWLPWSELTLQPRGTLDEFHSLLRKYPRSSVLRICARLSVFFNYGPDAGTTAKEDAVKYWIPALFPPVLVPRVQNFLAKERIIFFQAQLRFLAAETIRLTESHPEDGSVVPNFAIGEILLRAGELLYEHHEKPVEQLDQLANLISQFLPIYEMDSPTEAFFTFETILEDRMQQDKQLTRPFEAASKYVQRGVAGKLSVHMDVLQKLSDEVIKKYEVRDPLPPAEMVG